MKNRISYLFSKDEKILSVYFTAGYPHLNDTVAIVKNLEKSGVGLVEIGLPFSDPLADGPIIQQSSTKALKNGMNSSLLFKQLRDVRPQVNIPLIIMSYFNPIFRYGVENFCKKCYDIGIDGLIIPDLPLDIYLSNYKVIFEKYNLCNIFMVSPQTSEERIRKIDIASTGFIYVVSSDTTTGTKQGLTDKQERYFQRIKNMSLTSPTLIGFGISNKATFQRAVHFSNGAILGSAFIKFLQDNTVSEIEYFIAQFL